MKFPSFAVNSGLKLIWSELLTIVSKPNIDKIHMNDRQRRKSNDEHTSDNCETYLIRVLTTPLSLKQLSRIVIRNRIIENMKNRQFVTKYVLCDAKYQLNCAVECNSQISCVVKAISTPNRRIQLTSSILECLIWQLDIPTILHFYLYAFPDVPPMPDDIVVFVND